MSKVPFHSFKGSSRDTQSVVDAAVQKPHCFVFLNPCTVFKIEVTSTLE